MNIATTLNRALTEQALVGQTLERTGRGRKYALQSIGQDSRYTLGGRALRRQRARDLRKEGNQSK